MYRLTIDAYCITNETAELLTVAAQDVSLVRSLFTISMGGSKAMSEKHASPETPTGDVVMLEVGDDPVAAMTMLEEVFPCLSPSTAIIVLGRVNSIPFNEELLEGGVTEYMLLPATPSAVIARLGRIFQHDERGLTGRGRIISVFGAKGGIGSSTIAQNLAWSLQKITGKPVSLLDLDLHFGTVSINLNQDPRQGMRDALSRSSTQSLDSSMLERLYTKDTESMQNLWTLASNPSMADAGNIFTLAAVQGVVDLAASQASYVVVDVPQVWSPAITNVLSMSNETLVVCDHSIQSLRNAQMIFESLAPSKPTNTFIKYVLNHAGIAPLNDLAAKDFSDALGLSPNMVLQWLPKVFRASSSEGKLIGAMAGQVKLLKQFDDLAQSVSGTEPTVETSKKSAKPVVKPTAKEGGFLSGIFSKKKK